MQTFNAFTGGLKNKDLIEGLFANDEVAIWWNHKPVKEKM
jgi:hypothetical protein